MLGTITLTVGQTESLSAAPKEGAAETMGTIQDEVAPQVNGEKEQKECPNGSEITAVEEKAAEEKPSETNEVGFKKIFRFAGFKFTLKKDKNEEKNPVKLLTVKDKEEEEVSKAETAEEATTTGEEVTAKEMEVETEVKITTATEEAATTEVPAKEATATDAEAKDKGAQEAESSPPPPEAESNPPPTEVESSPAPPEVESSPPSQEAESSPPSQEAESSPPSQDAESSPPSQDAESSPPSEEAKISPPVHEVILSPFRKLFTGGLFSNLRKKNSIKSKEEEEKEKEAEGETAEAGETAQAETVGEEEKKVEAQQEEAKEDPPATTPEEVKPESTPEVEVTPAPDTTDEAKPAEEAEAAPEVVTEAEILSSQEKTKAQGSPLKKLFTGAGLKKLSTKKSKPKKDAESKLTESGEQTAEQLQSSTESAECQKPDSGASSPEDSGEHVIAEEALQVEQTQEVEGEEKKKEGIIPWSSFKKLVTPKRRVKKSSDSEDEATTEKAEKPVKSATLSSTESAVFTEKCNEEEDKEEKEDKPTEDEPKTENTEKLEGSTEESKRKMDTSVSWEALMCMGAKKRTRKTSDSDDDETKIEEETPAAEGGEEPESKPTETAVVTTQETDTEGAEGEVVSEPEPAVSTPPERETAWAILKRFVMPRIKAKTDEKTEENSEQVVSETEMAKEESSFSLRKFLPGRRKKKLEKQSSTEVEEDSETPAVVPLSEYDAEPAKTEEEPPVEAAITQTKASAEDRSPSWIPATVEDDDKQLSDIPEEAENAATPKSADTTIAEDVIEEQAILSTAEVKSTSVPEVTVTTPIPEGPKSETAEIVLEGIADQVSVIPCQTAVTVEDAPIDVAAAETEFEPPIEHADSVTKTILEAHTQGEAVAICTGLGTKEIAKLTLEKPVDTTIECLAETSDALCTLLVVEDKSPKSEEAIAAEVPIFVAQVHQVDSTEFNPVVEKPESDIPDIQTATEMEEPDIEMVAVVTSLPQQSETVQPPELSENSPKVVMVNPITPTLEATICTESVEVTEPDVETKEIEVGVEQVAAIEETAPLEEMAQAVSQEIISAISDTLKNTPTEVSEPAIPFMVPAEEVAVIQETVALVTPLSANVEQLETKDETAMEKVPISEPVGDEPIQVQETMAVCTTVVESVVNDSISAATYEVSASVIEHSASVVDAEPKVEQANAIEEQSMVIAQAVIQNAMEEVKEAEPEPKKADVQSPVQALSTTEENVELETERPVITDTPVPVTHETPAPVETPKSPKPLLIAMQVIDSVAVEVTESIDAPTDEIKPAEGLEEAVEVEESEAVEVEESEAIVLAEEVVELNTESQPSGNLEEEQSKVAPEDVKETSEEVIPEPEATKTETPTEEKKEEIPEIHMPAQVALQAAHTVEDSVVEEEAVMEFDSNGPVNDTAPAKETNVNADSSCDQKPVSDKLPTLLEETQTNASTELATSSQEAPVEATATSLAEMEMVSSSGKCAEVMAQVIEVIEEAVKEIEPISTELTAAS